MSHEVLVLLFAILLLWFVRMLVVNLREQRIARMQADLHAEMLSKIGTADEVVRYLECDAGRRLITAILPAEAEYTRRIAGTVQMGVLLVVSALGFYLITGLFDHPDLRGPHVLATLSIVGALGMGFLVSAAASHALARRWGLLGERSVDS